jgi:hypothetical protein
VVSFRDSLCPTSSSLRFHSSSLSPLPNYLSTLLSPTTHRHPQGKVDETHTGTDGLTDLAQTAPSYSGASALAKDADNSYLSSRWKLPEAMQVKREESFLFFMSLPSTLLFNRIMQLISFPSLPAFVLSSPSPCVCSLLLPHILPPSSIVLNNPATPTSFTSPPFSSLSCYPVTLRSTSEKLPERQ